VTTDEQIIARLSVMPESHVLAYFWIMVSEHAPRLELLEAFGKVRLERPPTWNYSAVRAEHEAWVSHNVRRDHPNCFACGAERPLFWHHVIEVQNGGSNHLRNRVSICFPCHKRLHPWLQEPADRRAQGFESLREIMARFSRRFTKKEQAS